MDGVLTAHNALEKKYNLDKAVEDAQKLIEQLQAARDEIAKDVSTAPLQMAKVKTPVKQSFEKIENDLREVNKGLNQYAKAMNNRFKSGPLPTTPPDVLSSQSDLINRAIAMHLLREGKFEVAKTFVREVNATQQTSQKMGSSELDGGSKSNWMKEFADPDAMEDAELAGEASDRGHLQKKFSEMYHILDALRNQHDLGPAIEWSRQHSEELELRGSNLEFELARLKFVELYTSEDIMSDDAFAGPVRALEYARATFPSFGSRYSVETSSLLGSLAFSTGLGESPYTKLFYNQDAWEEASKSFTQEFCGMLGLSSQSPLYTAVKAGGIAIPIMEKAERIIAQTHGQWTSEGELPVEIPLPPNMVFHSIFVCPVSKDQTSEENPPMLLPCGHVIARESLESHSRGKPRMKCPYCPNEAHPKDARRIYL